MDPPLPVGEAYRPVVPDAEVDRAEDEHAQEDADDDADGDVLGLEVAPAVVVVWRCAAAVGEQVGGDGAGCGAEWLEEGSVCRARRAVLHSGGRGGGVVGEGAGEGWYIHVSQMGQGGW